MSIFDTGDMGIMGDMFEPFVMMDKTTVDDGLFGPKTVYVEGAHFDAYARKDSSTEAQIAEQSGARAMYTVTVHAGTALSKPDVIKRVSDGLILRVTGSTVDNAAPPASTVQIAKTPAEEWSLPNDSDD